MDVIGWMLVIVMVLGVGALLGTLAFFRVEALQQELAFQREQLAALSEQRNPPAVAEAEIETADAPSTVSWPPPVSPSENEIAWPSIETDRHSAARIQPASALPAHSWTSSWLQHLVSHWMVWLGGLCVGLAGIFMVRYGIEAGLLGPRERVLLAVITGIGLHGAAEWLRRRNGSDPSFAALAGGASLTLYAALLAALHLYQLIDPRLLFVLLAVLSLSTMLLALVHGPFLAGIGILGAFVVPILVSTEDGHIATALLYSLMVTGAGLALLRFIYRPWLWWGLLAGSLAWWLISLISSQGDGLRGLYLAALVWGFVAIPSFDWLLRRGNDGPGNHRAIMIQGRTVRLDQLSLVLLVSAWGWSIYSKGFTSGVFAHWAPLIVILAFAARHRPWFGALPWLSLALQCVAWLAVVLHYNTLHDHWLLEALPDHQQSGFLVYAASMAALYSGLALLHLRSQGFSHGWLSLACLAPPIWLGVAYVLVSELHRSLNWAVLVLLCGLIYALLGGLRLRRSTAETSLWFVLAAHLAYSLAAAIWFREAGLTLVLAVQLVSLTWLKERHDLPWLGVVIKGILVLVVIRLTLNPWLVSYASDSHWSLWSGGGATLLCLLAARLCRDVQLRGWLEAATLHLLILTLGAEVRYWLYDGNVFVERYSLTEAAINASLWTAMALGYRYRAVHGQQLGNLYRICSRLLLGMGAASYALAVTVLNPWWSGELISPKPLANLLLLAYGLPVVMALLVALFHERRFRDIALAVAGAALLLFVSLEIRHLWQGALSLRLPIGNGELYSYSAVWLMLAAAATVAGGLWRWQNLYRAGMALLGVVIAKLFLVDMSGLEGLLRATSFMGLGLCLLALAWLHRRLAHR